MRILQIVDGDRWTGPAAVVFDQTAALIAAGVEAQFGYFGDSLLSARLGPLGWARPLLSHVRGPVGYAREVRRLREMLVREKIDVVHAHRSYDHTLAAFAVQGTPARLVRTLHHVRTTRPDPVTRLVFGRTDAFAYSNREIARRFRRPGPVLPPVVDADRFRPRDEGAAPPIPPNRFVVGTVGKMSRGRGHEEAICAGARLAAARLVHVGHGELQPELRRLVAALGAADRNEFLGYQEETLPDLYRSWDAVLFPASGADQGQRAILEAMASGLTVVAVDVPGVRDLVTDGADGLVVGGPEGLAPALARLADDPALRSRLGLAARSRALEFTPDRYASRARAFYESVLRGSPAPPGDASWETPSNTSRGSGRPAR